MSAIELRLDKLEALLDRLSPLRANASKRRGVITEASRSPQAAEALAMESAGEIVHPFVGSDGLKWCLAKQMLFWG